MTAPETPTKKSEPTINEEFGLYRAPLQSFAGEFKGTMEFAPGPKARDGNGLQGHGGDWMHISWQADPKTIYHHRIAHAPKTESELEGVLNEARDIFKYNSDRRKSEEEAAVDNAEAALSGLSPEQIKEILARLK
jgi:hypothetical protein